MIPNRKGEIPLYDSVDVLVAGGGPAGLGAAIAAARAGAQTLLVEYHGFPGGTGSFCPGMPINQMRPGGKPRSDVHELLIHHLERHGELAVYFTDHQMWCNVEYLKVAALDALEDAGCSYLLHTPVIDATVAHNGITGVVIGTKQGIKRIQAEAVIDCTGDADVAYFAGAETMKAEDELSPMTLCLNVTNVNMEQVEQSVHRKNEMKEVSQKAKERYPLIPQRWGLRRFPSSNCFYINHSCTRDHGIFDGTDPEQLTRAEALAHRQAIEMIAAMREHGGPAFSSVELIASGAQIGVRETRRVKGVYVLTERDAREGRTFDDVIAWRSGFLDIGFVHYERMKIHDVPYRAIIPESLDGLLMAGRCISATHVAASAGKSMGNCMATGHAAGRAAALAVERNCPPRELPVEDIQQLLQADGVDLTRGGEEQDIDE